MTKKRPVWGAKRTLRIRAGRNDLSRHRSLMARIARNYLADSPEKCFFLARKVMFADGEHKFAVRGHMFAGGEHKFAVREHKNVNQEKSFYRKFPKR